LFEPPNAALTPACRLPFDEEDESPFMGMLKIDAA